MRLGSIKRFGNRQKTNRLDLGKGIEMLVPEDMIWAFDGQSYYEKNVLHWLTRLIKYSDKPVFYDIGANLGYYSLMLSPFYKSCYAFEPVSSTYAVLEENLKLNNITHAKAIKLALGSKKQQTSINVYSSSGNNSIADRNIPEGHPLKFVKKETIQVDSLSAFVKAAKAPPPTLMKIDVEGSELDVLRGVGSVLKSKPTIMVEYSDATSNDAGYKKEELLEKLLGLGYKVYGLSDTAEDMKLYPPDSKKVLIGNLIAAPAALKL